MAKNAIRRVQEPMTSLGSTKLWARILGPWTLLVALGMIADRQNAVAVVSGFFTDAALMWTAGIVTTLVGLVIVVTHNRWSGGVLPPVVTLYGWIALVKGVAFVWLPASAEAGFYGSLRFGDYFYFYFAASVAIGACLTYGGFRAAAERGP